MNSYLGKYSASQMAETTAATLILSPKEIRIGINNAEGLHRTMLWQYNQIHYKYMAADDCTVITNTSTKEQIFVEQKNIEKELHAALTYDNKSWFNKKMGSDGLKLAGVFALIVGALTLLYFLIVPFLSEQLARRVSKKQEAIWGDKLFSVIVDTTKKDDELTLLVNQYFKALEINTDYKIKITVIKDPTVNAFAILGGNIVVFTGLLQKIKTHEALAALLSHEFTHINNKHTTKRMFRQLGSTVFLGLLFGDIGSVGNVILNNADNLNGLKYSRKLEKEADINGLEILKERDINAQGFTQLFKHLKNEDHASPSEIISSHPDLDNRIKYIEKHKLYQTGKASSMNDSLQAIFNKIRGDSDF
jgi:beta-barrel assembly-enhancing protease